MEAVLDDGYVSGEADKALGFIRMQAWSLLSYQIRSKLQQLSPYSNSTDTQGTHEMQFLHLLSTTEHLPEHLPQHMQPSD
jgi:hypothetical protein